MNSRFNAVIGAPPFGLSRRAYVYGLAGVMAIVPFVVGASLGGYAEDREILPLVRFLAAVKLALGFATSVAVSRLCWHSRRRSLVGQSSAGCMSLGAGFLWTGAAFGAGFAFFMGGTLVLALLMSKELARRGWLPRSAR